MAVPNTTTFTLANVCDELSLTGANRNLVQCFDSAVSGNFDATYSGAKNSLLNFRNYGAVVFTASPLNITLGASTGGRLITITASGSWSLTSSVGLTGWVNVNPTSGTGNNTITVSYTAFVNEGRIGSFTLISSGIDVTVFIEEVN